jgi:hypothetical protein
MTIRFKTLRLKVDKEEGGGKEEEGKGGLIKIT